MWLFHDWKFTKHPNFREKKTNKIYFSYTVGRTNNIFQTIDHIEVSKGRCQPEIAFFAPRLT